MTHAKTERRDMWAAHVHEWRASGLAATDYAKQHGFDPSNLYRWARRFARETEPTKSIQPAFVQMEPRRRERSVTEGVMEIHVGAGAFVRVVGAVEQTLLREALEVVLSCSA